MDDSLPKLKEPKASANKKGWGGRWVGIALAAVALGTLLRLLPNSFFGGGDAVITFYPAVALVALLAGRGAGLLATVLSALIADILFFEPHGTFAMRQTSDCMALGLFLVAGTLISLMGGRLRDARLEARKSLERDRLDAVRLEAQAQLARLTNIAPVSITQCDRDGHFRFVNQTFAHRFGLIPADCIGKRIPEIIGEKAYDTLRPNIEKALQGQSVEFQMTVDYRIAGRRFVHGSLAPDKDGTGAVIGCIAAMTDLTELRKTEEALRQNAERVRLMFEQSTVGQVETDPETGRFLRVNPKFCQITGYSESELLTRTFSDITHPDDRTADRERFERLVRGETQGYQCEKRYVRPDGAVVFAALTVNLVRDPEGRPLRTFALVKDLTSRKAAEEAATANRRRLQDVIDNTPALVYALDAEQRFVMVNKALAELVRSAPDQMIGKRRHDFIPAEDADWHEANDRLVLKAGRPLEFEEYSRLKEGSITWLTTKFPLRDSAGNIYAVGGISANITERKRAEEALRRGKEMTEAVNRISTVLHSTLKTDEVVRRIVDEGAKVLGSDTAAITEREGDGWRVRYAHGMPPQLAGMYLNDDQERHAVHALQSGEILAIEDAFNDERVNREHLRHWNIRSVLLAPLITHGKPFGVLFFNYHQGTHAFTAAETSLARQLAASTASALENARLFEEIRQTEEALSQEKERLRLALEGARAGSWETDLETGLNKWGPDKAELLGVPAERRIGEQDHWGDYIHPDDRQRVLESFAEASKHPGNQWTEEFRVIKADGSVAWLASYGSCFESSDGKRRMLGVSLDITTRKAAEEVLARDKAELERLVEERTARLQELVNELEHFSYTITHDMRAPLRAMRGLAEIMNGEESEWSAAERQKFLGRIITAAERMDSLITDALNYSKAVRQDLPLAPVDVHKLLRGMLETYPEFQTGDADIRIEETFPPVMGNEAALTQCFSNLLTNAVKFAKAGEKPVITVRSEIVAEGERAGWIRFWVEDNGVGISESLRPRVFDMFSRGSHPQVGTGIGLALVRKVVDRMGGHVGVESEEGKGTRFWLELKPAMAMEPRFATELSTIDG